MMANTNKEIQKRAERAAEKLKVWQRPKDGGKEIFWDWYLHTECYQISKPL